MGKKRWSHVFHKVQNEMQTTSSRIWTQFSDLISYDVNYTTKCASIFQM